MALTYSITGGADAALFTITTTAAGGELKWKTPPNFENPTDADRNNVYLVQVGVSDGVNTTKQDITVTVKDVNENLPPQITSAPAVSVNENTQAVMTVTATDPDATTPPQPTGSIPLSFDDPRFTSAITGSTVQVQQGQTRENLSIREQSGNPTITMFSNTTIRNCRTDSREGPRIASSGTYTIDGCYHRANMGSSQDHSDVVQTYAPGARGTINLRNSCFEIGTGHCGIFVADNWTGTIDIQNCCFIKGQFGVRCHPDTGGDNIIRMRDVFFVGPFANDPFFFSDVAGHTNVIEVWENVRNATIQNGQLVPGTVIPKPTAAQMAEMTKNAPPKPAKKKWQEQE